VGAGGGSDGEGGGESESGGSPRGSEAGPECGNTPRNVVESGNANTTLEATQGQILRQSPADATSGG
jgi:hypothetical protein